MVHAKSATAALYAIVLLLLVGCAAQGLQPQNTKESIFVTAQYATATVETANRLHEQGLIDAETHDRALDEAVKVSDTLANARSLMDAGNEDAAMARVDTARSVLTAVRDELREVQNEQ